MTGFAFGITMPFIVGVVTAPVSQSAGNNSGIIGLVTGISSVVFWSTTGSRLNWKRRITFPEQYGEGFSPEGRLAFESGYTETVREKRKASYSFGFIVGFLVPVGFALHALANMGPIGV
ncbi:hypothetical protein ACFL6K_03550 [Candidatus Latescibacterota bacterium]